MILSALNNYYETLLAEGKVQKLGWSSEKISYILELTQDGKLQNVIPAPDEDFKQIVPMPVKRSSGIASNFLCDNSSYLLGIDNKDKPSRSIQCFEAARLLHHDVLAGVDALAARALLAFFDLWDPKIANLDPVVENAGEELLKGGKLIFSVQTDEGPLFPSEDPEIIAAWERHRVQNNSDDEMICLVTGKRGPIARLHPSIKGLWGAQASGATLVGFNAESFESYGHNGEQGRNAPVSTSVAQAYVAALNYLLAEPNHHARIGDTTLTFWSEHHDTENSEAFNLLMFKAQPQKDKMDPMAVDAMIGSILENVAVGKPVRTNVDLKARFFILGISPNASRIAVRFFLQDTFGNMLKNIAKHYEQLQIAHAPGLVEHLTPYWLLQAVENENASKSAVSSTLFGPLLRAILTGSRYPDALYQKALLRVHATQKVTYERAAIIKAYLLRNRNRSRKEITVELNEELTEQAYLLGRLFALFENIQKRANGTATITSHYFNAANTNPASVFPTLYRLSLAHLTKLERDAPGLAHYFANQRSELLTKARINDGMQKLVRFPAHLNIEQQGSFILGYEMQRRSPWKKDEQVEMQDDKNGKEQE